MLPDCLDLMLLSFLRHLLSECRIQKLFYLHVTPGPWLTQQVMNQDCHMTRQNLQRSLDTPYKFGLSYRRKQKDDNSFCKVLWNNYPNQEATRQKFGFRRRHPASSPTEQHLNLEDEIPVRRVDCNHPGFWRSQKYELFKKFEPMCEACRCQVKQRTTYK